MTILYIISGLDTGGAENVLLEIAKRIQSRDYKCQICALYGRRKNLDRFKDNASIPIIQFNWRNKINPFMIFKLLKTIQKVKPHIVHTHLIHATLYGRIAARIAHVPVILTTEHNTSNWAKKYFLIHLLYRFTSKWNTKIFVISNAVKMRLIKFTHVNSSCVEVIYNGIDIKWFQQKPDTLDKIKQVFTKPVIGTVGRLDSRKGHRYLIDASTIIFRNYPETTFVFIGAGKEEPRLKKQIKILNLPSSHFHFLGTQKDIRPYLKQMDLFVLPSIEEGLGLAILEAMAIGIPVVATNVGGISEIIKHGENGLLAESRNPKALAEAILSVLNDSHFSRLLCKKAKKQVEQNFNIDSMINQLIRQYTTYVNQSTRKREMEIYCGN